MVQLKSLGFDNNIAEVFLKVRDKKGRILAQLTKNLGAGHAYQCTGLIWRTGVYTLRLRKNGSWLHIALTKTDEHEDFSMVVPGATHASTWR